MSAERDELAKAIFNAPALVAWNGEQKVISDAILAAGYRKPRTITTAEELAATPGGIVVREPLGLIWEKQGDGEGGTFWVETGDEQEYKDADISLPATVLWEPQP